MMRTCTAAAAVALALSGCAAAPGMAPPSRDVSMVAGPPIRDIVTAFDGALSCLRGKIDPNLTFAVGAIIDHTGKEQLTEGGAGKFITQGAGDIVQSALFRAGATVVNRRDPRVMTIEVEWNIRDPRRIVPAKFYITGSINSLDFIPGGGVDIAVAGVGPRYRQNRLLVGLDLAMTDADTGRIVANVPLQKQIFSSEAGLGIGRFFGETLVSLDIGGKEREALHFALRQMLNLATFDLLAQLMRPQSYAPCRRQLDGAEGEVAHTGTAEAALAYEAANGGAIPAVAPAGPLPAAAALPPRAPVPARSGAASQPANPVTAPRGEASPDAGGFFWQDEAPGGPGPREVSTLLPS